MKTLRLRPGKERSLLRRHPWIFESAIAKGGGDSGETVRVESHEGQFLAWAAFSPTSRIRARVWSFDEAQRIDAPFFIAACARSIIARARFDVQSDGSKLAQEDFASLAQRTPQTHGTDYKYLGNYLELFELMQRHLPTYKIEAPKLLKLLVFNYLFSNGDAHLKNFSVIETSMGDYRLSPAYDLLNSRIHIEDKDFALDDGLLPKNLAQGKIGLQFAKLAELAGISEKNFQTIMELMLSKSDLVEKMVVASFLNDTTKRNYLQSYQGRLKQLVKA